MFRAWPPAQVRASSGAAGAREAFEIRRPDVVVTDIGMPGGDGNELLASLRSIEGEQNTPGYLLLLSRPLPAHRIATAPAASFSHQSLARSRRGRLTHLCDHPLQALRKLIELSRLQVA
jgi:CheY-like chemotaxis protein